MAKRARSVLVPGSGALAMWTKAVVGAQSYGIYVALRGWTRCALGFNAPPVNSDRPS